MKKMISIVLTFAAVLGIMVGFTSAAENSNYSLSYTELVAPQYEDVGYFDEELAAVKKNGKWGYIDENNKTVIPFKYDYANAFVDGKAIVGINETLTYFTGGSEEVTRIGFVDTKGKYTQFTMDGSDFCEPYLIWDPDCTFHNGWALISYGEGSRTLFDSNGKAQKMPEEYCPISIPGDDLVGLYVPMSANYKTIFAKPDGKGAWSVAFELTEYEHPVYGKADAMYGGKFSGGIAPVQVSFYNVGEQSINLTGFIDTKGKWLIEPQYDAYRWFGIKEQMIFDDENGIAMLSKNGTWGGIDINNNIAIPFKYEALHTQRNGMTAFKQNGKWGFMNEKQTAIIAAQYDNATSFNSAGYAIVSKNGVAYAIDKLGRQIQVDKAVDLNTYFREDGIVINPGSNTVVIEKNGMYGFGRIELVETSPKLTADSISDETDANITVGIKLSWTKISNAVYYRIYRNLNGGSFSLLADKITATTYVDLDISPNATYNYIVKPYFANGSEGDISNWTNESSAATGSGEMELLPDANGELGKPKSYILMQIGNQLMDVNGTSTEIDPGRGTTPILRYSRTMLPVRALVESMSGTAGWDSENQEVSLAANSATVNMWIGQMDYTANGESKEMDIAPFIKNSRTMLPLRFVTENLNCKVTWLNATKEILIVFNGVAKGS